MKGKSGPAALRRGRPMDKGGSPMPVNEYYESVSFSQGAQFNIARAVDTGYINKLHWHPFLEILVSLADGNRASVNFNPYPMGINDILIIYPGDLHSIEGQGLHAFLIIQLPYALFTGVNALHNNANLFSQYPLIPYDPASSQADNMVMLLKALADTSREEDPFKEVRMYSLLLRFFELVGRCCLERQKTAPSPQATAEQKLVKRMAQACLFISQNCTKPLTLAQTAAQLGIGKSYFANLFKRYTNTTFVAFLTAERIKHAQLLFRNPNAHIIDIAFDSGFTSLSAFNRAFKKTTGMSPSQFRKNMIGDMV